MACLPCDENQDVIDIGPTAAVPETTTSSEPTTATNQTTTIPLPSNPSKSVQTLPEAPSREELQQSLHLQSDRIIFLETSLQTAEAEKVVLQGIINNGRIAYGQLYNAYEQLKQQGVRVCTEYNDQINQLQLEVEALRQGKFAETRVIKQYKELGESARTKLKRKFRDAFVVEMNDAIKKRGLEVVHIEMRDIEGTEDKIRVNAQKAHTFDQLMPLEKQRVEDISDVISIKRISNSAYAALRAFTADLVPLTHLKAHDALIKSFLLSSFQKAPGRKGAFCSVIDEVAIQIDHLWIMGYLKRGEIIFVKAGIDATRLTTKMSVCMYTVQVISDSSSRTGAVGACVGGDAYEDLILSGRPFFQDVEKLAKNPQIESHGESFSLNVLMGGDMANILEIFGLSKASSRNPCEFCTLDKNSFHFAAQESFEGAQKVNDACNSFLARNKANILNAASEPAKNFGVKRAPISPLPLDPAMALINVVLICMLHMRLRLVGKKQV